MGQQHYRKKVSDKEQKRCTICEVVYLGPKSRMNKSENNTERSDADREHWLVKKRLAVTLLAIASDQLRLHMIQYHF